MMRRFVNNKYQETLYFLLEAIFTTGCGFWWTYPQMAIGAILSIIATTMQLIYRDIKSEKKYDKFWSIGNFHSISNLVFLSLECSDCESMRDSLF